MRQAPALVRGAGTCQFAKERPSALEDLLCTQYAKFEVFTFYL